MPRDSSGNYTLPAGNPVVDGTIIDVNWANPTMADVAVQLNNLITRDGLLGATGPIGFANGSAALPSITFSAEPTTGIYRGSSGHISLSIAAAQVADFTAAATNFKAGGTTRVTIDSTQVTFANSITVGNAINCLGASAFTGAAVFNGGASGTWTGNVTGNVSGSAATLNPGRNINGVLFNGSANITIADSTKLPTAGGTLTGTITSDSTVAEPLRIAHSAGFISGYNNANSVRTGYLQFTAGTKVTLNAEQANTYLQLVANNNGAVAYLGFNPGTTSISNIFSVVGGKILDYAVDGVGFEQLLNHTSSYAGLQLDNPAGTRCFELLYLGAASGGAYGAGNDDVVMNLSAAAGKLVWSMSDAMVMQLTHGGNLGINTAPACRLHSKSSSEILRLETTTARGGGQDYIGFNDPTGNKGYMGYAGVDDTIYMLNTLNAPAAIWTNNLARLTVSAGGTVNVVNTGGLTVNSQLVPTDSSGATYSTNLPIGTIIGAGRVGPGSGIAVGATLACNATNYIQTLGFDAVTTNIQYGTWRSLGGSINSVYGLWLRVS